MRPLTTIIGLLADPSAAITDTAIRRRLRVVALGSLVVLALGLPATTLTLVLTPEAFMGDPWLVYGLYGLIAAFYVGTRTRFWQVVLLLFAVAGTAGVWAMLASSASTEEMMPGLVLALLPFLMAVLVPARWGVTVVIGVSAVGALWTTYTVPGLDLEVFAKALCLVLVVGSLIVGLQELARADRNELADRAVELQAAWAETKNAKASRSRFLAKIQHELRTPLNGVIGAAQVLQEIGTDPLVLELAEAVRDSGDRLAFLVEDVLAFVASDANDIEIVRSEVVVGELLAEIVERSRAVGQRSGVGVSVDVAEMPSLLIDRSRVGHVVGHLVRNAVSHSQGGAVRVACFWRHGELVLAVHDSGPGLNTASLERAFEPLTGEVAGASHQEGLGLGLATSRLLATAMGGSLEATSEPGQGSTFSLKIPATAYARRAAA